MRPFRAQPQSVAGKKNAKPKRVFQEQLDTLMYNDLTVVLLLKGRDSFTRRWFEYAKEFKLPYKVIVADGGEGDGLENELLDKGFHQWINYEYIKYPYDENYKIFYAKVLDALTKVDTPYVLLASNDDFYFFDALEESVSFLKEHTDFVASRGELWDFRVASSFSASRQVDDDSIYGDMEAISQLYYHPTVIGESATDRVNDFSLKFNAIWHDVVKTHDLKGAYSTLIESNIYGLALSDTLVCYLLASQGKLHRGSQLYMLHQSHSDMAALTESYNSPFEWIDSPGWDSDLDSFLNMVAARISKIDQISFYEAKSKLIRSYFEFVLKIKMRGYFQQFNKKNITTKSSIIY